VSGELSEDSPKGFGRVKNAGTAIAVVASCVALTFTLFPGLIPDPKVVLAAQMTIVDVEPNMSLRSYLRLYRPQEAVEEGDEDYIGTILFLRIKTDGKKHGDVKLTQLHYGWDSKRPLTGGRFKSNQHFRPDTPSDQWIAPVWVEQPQQQKDYFVRLMLLDDDTILDFVDSKRIRAPQ
jgi:hypothetical protein